MHISYADHHAWLKTVSSAPLQSFGDSDKKKLTQALSELAGSNIMSVITPLTDEHLLEFLPLYTKRLGEKENPKFFDIRAKTLGSSNGRTYYIHMLHDQGAYVGGTIFSLTEKSISVAYRSHETKWPHAALLASPALCAEYLLMQHALELGKIRISHGKDRNPYGMNASIGLAIWKLAIGCLPVKSNDAEMKTLDTETVAEDMLVLVYPGEARRIREAYLLTTPETEQRWLQATKYPERLKVATIYRSN